MNDDTDIAIEVFIEQPGLIAQTDRIPCIAGRVICLLVNHGGPFSFRSVGVLGDGWRYDYVVTLRAVETIG